jgi:hypothetical protein
MTIKKDNANGSAGVLAGIKIRKGTTIKELTEELNNIIINTPGNKKTSVQDSPYIESDPKPLPEVNKALDRYNDIKKELKQAKELIIEDEESVRRTFTIEVLTHTQLNELKIYVLPATTGKKKWGYNDIVNLAIKEFYIRQKAVLCKKLQK